MSEPDANPAEQQAREPEITGPPVLMAEMFELVISKMNVNEWIACRAVCKFFKQVVEKVKVRNLAIAESEDSACESVFSILDYDVCHHKDYQRFSDRFYFVSNDPVYQSDALITPNTTAGLRMLVNHFDLSQLRRLFVVEVRDGRAHFDLLNRLIQLEHLQINCVQMDGDLKLELPNLRILSIVKLNGGEDFHVSLAIPNLKYFETRTLRESRFRFVYPDSVTFLQVRELAHEDVFKFRSSLEVLICENADDLVWIDIAKERNDEGRVLALNLSAFEKLRRVDCVRMNREQAEKLYELCQVNEIDFYYCGQRIDNQNRVIGEYLEDAGEKDRLKPLKINSLFEEYDRLADSLYCMDGIQYFRNFDPYFPDKLPKDFAKKFYLVRELFVEREIKNVKYFIEFLSCFKNLKVLWLENATLPQEFFDRYSHLFSRLHQFQYKHSSMCSRKIDNVNLGFILNFKLLEWFMTYRPISMRLISEAFNSLKHLNTFIVDRDIHETSPIFTIRRTEQGYELKDFCAKGWPTFKFSSKAEMLKCVEERFPELSKRD